MSRKISCFFTMLLLWLACKSPEDQSQSLLEQEDRLVPYNLTVILRGLVAIVPKANDKAWALLVDAEYDPTRELVAIDDLPPCTRNDFCGGAQCATVRTDLVLHDFPPHYAYMRIRNAKLNGVPKELLMPMAGTDLRINPSRTGGTADLALLSSFQKIKTARCSNCNSNRCDAQPSCKPKPDPEPLDSAGSNFLDSDPKVALAQPALSGRVLLQLSVDDELVAKKSCTTLEHSFASRTDETCDGATIDLADETVLIHKNLTVPTTLVFNESGTDLILEPINSTTGIEIIIGNQVADAILHPGSIRCQDSGHPKVFRWFYRLSATAGQADCSNHYYPCLATAGGRKCPQKFLN